MYFMAAPAPVSPPNTGLSPLPLAYVTPMKDAAAALAFAAPVAGSMATAAPPSYEAIVLDPNGPRSQTNLFVRKLASAVTEEDMRKLFDQYGTIMSFALMRDIHTGESLGTAFVRYSTHDEARNAMAALDGRELYGRPISIQWAKREHDSTPSGDARRKIRKLFVRNIPLDVTARHLRQLFAKFGSINNVTLHSDTAPAASREVSDVARPASQTRNIAFILFQEDDVAEKAVTALHNTCPFENCEGIPLMVKLAEDNRDRIDRKQRFTESTAATTGAKALAAAVMMQGSQLSMAAAAAGSSVSPQTIPLSTPASAAISPSTMSIDVNHGAPLFLHDGRVPSLPQGASPGLPFAIAGGAPTATATPMQHATVDANGNPMYVYVAAAAAPNGMQSTAPTAAAAAAGGAPSLPYMFAPSTAGASGLPAPQPGQILYPSAPTASPGMHPFYPSMALPSMYIDAQGRPVQGPPAPAPPQTTPSAAQAAGMFVPNYFPGFVGAQPPGPAPLPFFSMPAGATAHPLQASTSAAGSEARSGPAAASFHHPSPAQSLSHTMPAMMPTQPTFSVSPQLSSAGSVLERVPTAGGGVSSNSDSPVNAALTAALMSSQPPVPTPHHHQHQQQHLQAPLTLPAQSFIAGAPASSSATAVSTNVHFDVTKDGMPASPAATFPAFGSSVGAAGAPVAAETRSDDEDEMVWSNFAAHAFATTQ